MSIGGRWSARPGLARAVGLVATFTPVVVGVAVGTLVARSFDSVVTAALVSLPLSLLVVWLVQRVTRRLVPLVTLLHLDLPFPTAAPSRFGVALRAGSIRSLPKPGEAPEDVVRAAGDILALATALSNHDRATRGHSERVRALTDLLGEELGLDRDDRDRLRWAALLHDIGKLTVHHEVLNKPAGLDPEEWELLRRHPLEGAQRVEPLADFLGEWVKAVEHHHERWDGGGYPHGLARQEISRGARIVAVADVYEVMTSRQRIYRAPVPPSVAQRELAAVAGTQLDPEVVGAFLRLHDRDVRRAMNLTTLILQVPGLLRWRQPLRVVQPTAMGEPGEVLDGTTAQPHPAAQRHDAAMPHADASPAHDLPGDLEAGDDVAGAHDR